MPTDQKKILTNYSDVQLYWGNFNSLAVQAKISLIYSVCFRLELCGTVVVFPRGRVVEYVHGFPACRMRRLKGCLNVHRCYLFPIHFSL